MSWPGLFYLYSFLEVENLNQPVKVTTDSMFRTVQQQPGKIPQDWFGLYKFLLGLKICISSQIEYCISCTFVSLQLFLFVLESEAVAPSGKRLPEVTCGYIGFLTRAFPEVWWTFKTFISKLHNLFHIYWLVPKLYQPKNFFPVFFRF